MRTRNNLYKKLYSKKSQRFLTAKVRHSRQNDIDNRKIVWHAIASFYLDTELLEYDYERIAALFTQSGFSITELKKIDLYEVFPVLKDNLLTISGVWNGIDEGWLNKACTLTYYRRNNIFFRMKVRFYNRVLYTMRKEHWIKIESIMRSKATPQIPINSNLIENS
tara:strand:+ start:924 stop:1418 length:495 start_codon:yes stop_codon:yes gene_type:complete